MSRGNRHQMARAARDAVARGRRLQAERKAALQAAAEKHAHEELRSALIEVQLHLYGLPDGDRSPQALHLLSHLAWLIGMGAELAHALNPGGPEARRLHGALRQVLDLCLMGRGYTWRSEFAPVLERAAMDSHALLLARPELAVQMIPGANYLSNRVRSRSLTADDVAGAEIYREREALRTAA